MHHYRQALMRMRQGDSDRDIAKSRLMGRRAAAALRTLAQGQGWLDAGSLPPDDAAIAATLTTPKRAGSTISGLEPLREQIAGWFGCHRRAFEGFAAVPERIIIDNAKCAITQACAHDPQVQRSYADCAEGYGFRIDACPPHDPQKKGIVESGVKYLKGNFLPLRTFRNLTDLNAQAKCWVMEEAGRRRHGTTGEAPLVRFERERAWRLPLPAVAPDLGVWSQATLHRDGPLPFDRAFYSAPWPLIGKRLWLKARDGRVSIDDEHRAVAAHGRASRPGERRTVRDHWPPEAPTFFAHDRAWCIEQAARIGPACVELIEPLLSDRIAERLRAALGVLRLSKSYTAVRLEAACARALAHG